MDKEKKKVGKWWMWILLLLIITTIIFSGLHYAGMFGQTVAERVIFENSYQYSEARKTEIAMFEAQLAEISRLLSGNVSEETRNNLEAQASSLRVLLNVARSKSQ